MQTVDDLAQEAFLMDHFKMIRADPDFATTPIVTIIESNLAWVTASHIARVASMYSPIVHLIADQSKHNRVGVWMTNDIKETMKRDTFVLLDTERVHMSYEFVSNTPSTRANFANQLRNYKYEVKPAKDAFSKPKMIISGKGYNANDDLAIVFQMIIFWSQRYYENPKNVKSIVPAK